MTNVKMYSGVLTLVLIFFFALYLNSVQANEDEILTQFAMDWDNDSKRNLTGSSNSPNGARLPQIATSPDGSRIMVVFNHQESGAANNNDPYYVASGNNGATWSTPNAIFVSNSINSIQPSISFDNLNNAHAVWVEGETTLLYAPESAGWPTNSPVQISTDPNPPGNVAQEVDSPKIFVSSSMILDAVWIQRNSGGFGAPNIYHARSSNGGATWNSDSIDELETAVASRSPDIYVNGSNVFIVWQEEIVTNRWEIKYAISTDGGVNWSFPITISDNDERSAERPSITRKNGVLEVIFSNKDVGTAAEFLDDQTIQHVTCSSACTTRSNWTNPSNKASGFDVGANTNNSEVIVSSITTSGDCSIVSYHGTKDGLQDNNEIIFNTTSCEGESWVVPQEVTGSGIRSLRPSLAANDDFVFMVYTQAGESPTSEDQIKFIRGELIEFTPIPTIYLPILFR